MKQAKEVARQFKEELNQLLKKYNATIELQEQNTIHWERGDEHIIVYIDAVYKDGDCLAEWAEIDLGRNIYPD